MNLMIRSYINFTVKTEVGQVIRPRGPRDLNPEPGVQGGGRPPRA